MLGIWNLKRKTWPMSCQSSVYLPLEKECAEEADCQIITGLKVYAWFSSLLNILYIYFLTLYLTGSFLIFQISAKMSSLPDHPIQSTSPVCTFTIIMFILVFCFLQNINQKAWLFYTYLFISPSCLSPLDKDPISCVSHFICKNWSSSYYTTYWGNLVVFPI